MQGGASFYGEIASPVLACRVDGDISLIGSWAQATDLARPSAWYRIQQ